jgi:hypothetical protein
MLFGILIRRFKMKNIYSETTEASATWRRDLQYYVDKYLKLGIFL